MCPFDTMTAGEVDYIPHILMFGLVKKHSFLFL